MRHVWVPFNPETMDDDDFVSLVHEVASRKEVAKVESNDMEQRRQALRMDVMGKMNRHNRNDTETSEGVDDE